MTAGRRTAVRELDGVASALEAQARLVGQALSESDPSSLTRCEGWDVRELDRHLGAVTGGLADLLSRPVTGPAEVGLAGWAAVLPGLAPELGREAREAGPGLTEGAGRLLEALGTADPAAVVEQRTGRHSVRDAALFRLIELVAHGRDLPEPVTPDRQALKLVSKALTGLLAERAPGRHVELRVPPFAAVQCVEGPRHTRGTPPNVVECDPVAFVELATGRLSWPEATADGRTRTWGDRADLSPWLPLLR